jgi:hypothetical protein
MSTGDWLEERVAAAVELLAPKGHLLEECSRVLAGDIAEINEIEMMRVIGRRHTNKDVKKAAARLAAAAARLEIVLVDFQPFTGKYWTLQVDVSHVSLERLVQLRDQANKMAIPRSPSSARSDRQINLMAVETAARLLAQFSDRTDASRGHIGKLAAVLLGRPKSNLTRYVSDRTGPKKGTSPAVE